MLTKYLHNIVVPMTRLTWYKVTNYDMMDFCWVLEPHLSLVVCTFQSLSPSDFQTTVLALGMSFTQNVSNTGCRLDSATLSGPAFVPPRKKNRRLTFPSQRLEPSLHRMWLMPWMQKNHATPASSLSCCLAVQWCSRKPPPATHFIFPCIMPLRPNRGCRDTQAFVWTSYDPRPQKASETLTPE